MTNYSILPPGSIAALKGAHRSDYGAGLAKRLTHLDPRWVSPDTCEGHRWRGPEPEDIWARRKAGGLEQSYRAWGIENEKATLLVFDREGVPWRWWWTRVDVAFETVSRTSARILRRGGLYLPGQTLDLVGDHVELREVEP
jgi:hypothetical protein